MQYYEEPWQWEPLNWEIVGQRLGLFALDCSRQPRHIGCGREKKVIQVRRCDSFDKRFAWTHVRCFDVTTISQSLASGGCSCICIGG